MRTPESVTRRLLAHALGPEPSFVLAEHLAAADAPLKVGGRIRARGIMSAMGGKLPFGPEPSVASKLARLAKATNPH